MIQKTFKKLWKVIDILCFIAAVAFIVWGFFRLNITAGIFSVGFAFIVFGLVTELISS